MKNKKIQGIYNILSQVDGKVYIGQVHINKGHKRRFYEHITMLRGSYHYNKHLQNAWNKYGEANFVFDIIEEVENEMDLDACEQKWLDSTQEYHYNIQKIAGGSVLGQKRTLTEIAKLNIFNANKKRVWDDDAKKLLSNSLKGIKRDDAFKQKRREIMLGSKASEETRKKQSIALKGRIFSNETIEKMRKSAILRYKNKIVGVENVILYPYENGNSTSLIINKLK